MLYAGRPARTCLVAEPNTIIITVSLGVRIKATGNAGHGSALLQGTAVERLERVLSSIQAFRAEQIQRLARSEFAARDSGKFTSINITMLEAGKQMNVIPDEATAGLAGRDG